VEKVCRKMGIREATFYNWNKKYGGWGYWSCVSSGNWKKKMHS